uniref:Carboxylic ester hydrolase n=1 Tax=Anolis carolinensis TaxID=28377 RepID=R4G9Q4_ANOCA|nr:PREDICTED: cholinesterase [Anolis carolinensis]|eukprot:XP_003218003.2 PREDICTED: cholinesterase [Anolis carolinensis]
MPTLLPAIFLFLLISSSASEEDDTLVNTSSGPIKGKKVPTNSGTVTAYLGIPYAEPPLGKLRFQKPLPHQPWSQVLEATSYGSPCHQKNHFNFTFADMWVAKKPHSEDCLFLNIWVPDPRPSTPVPVLLWIHGGGFVAGASSLDLYNGAFLAAAENVIVASMNYRLGVLGFLFLPPEAPGNMGLWDQNLAMKWIKENAAAFGGDPAHLTLLGHSAGAASVGFHLLSPASQPLFTHAVIQSGLPNAPWAWRHPNESMWAAMKLSEILNCEQGNHSDMESCLHNVMNCLRKANPEKDEFYLVEKFQGPTLDGDFLPAEAEKLKETGLSHDKPLLLGITRDEGSIFTVFANSNILNNGGILTWEELVQAINMVFHQKVEDSIVKALAKKYSEDTHGPGQYHSALSHLYRDYYFLCPLVEVTSKMGTSGSPVYVYSFNHPISGPLWPEWMGAPHGVEVPYLFGTFSSVLTNNETITKADVALSRRLMWYWAEFARSGNPTGSKPSVVQWPLYNATEQNVFHIDIEAPRTMPIAPVQCNFPATHQSYAKQLKGHCISSDHEKDIANGASA